MKFKIFASVLILSLMVSTLETFGESNSTNPNQNFPLATITPEEAKYGETVWFHLSLPSYDKPDEETYYFNVLNPKGVRIDSTLWFATQDYEYEFRTSHPAHNVTESGTYSLIIEKANVMEPSGEIVSTSFFEIITNPPPKIQDERGVNPNDVKCNQNLKLIFKSSYNSPSCVKPESIPKLIERGWAKLENNSK